MLEMVSGRNAPMFEFLPAIDRRMLGALAQRPCAAIVPSRFETFCLAAHELRAVGLPLLVAPLPAFVDYFSEEAGALLFDGTVEGLASAILRIREDRELAERLFRGPRPDLSTLRGCLPGGHRPALCEAPARSLGGRDDRAGSGQPRGLRRLGTRGTSVVGPPWSSDSSLRSRSPSRRWLACARLFLPTTSWSALPDTRWRPPLLRPPSAAPSWRSAPSGKTGPGARPARSETGRSVPLWSPGCC